MSVATSYAQALYEAAQEGNQKEDLTSLVQDLSSLCTIIDQNKEVRVALVSPATSSKEKLQLIEALESKLKFSPLLGRFLQLLAKKGRLSFLSQIVSALEKVRMKASGGTLGELCSADPIDPSDIKEVADAFQKKLGKSVEFRVSTDPRLLAGIKVTVDGVTYDGTLRSQLDRLQNELIHE